MRLKDKRNEENGSTDYTEGSRVSKEDNDKNNADEIPTSTKPSLGRLATLVRPETFMLVLSLILMVLSEGSQLVTPLIIANAFDALIDTSITDDNERMELINYYMMITIVITVTSIMVGFLRSTIQGIIGERVVARLRCQLYAQILKQEIAFFDENKSGELNSRLGSDTTLLQAVISQYLPDVLVQSIKGIWALVLMFVLSTKLAGVAVGGVAFIFLMSTPLGAIMAKLSKEYQNVLAQAQNHSTEAICNMRTVQGFAAESKETHRYDNKIGNPDDTNTNKCCSWYPPKDPKTTYRVGFLKSMIQSGFFSWVFGCGFGFLNVTLWYGFYLVIEDELTLGGLTAFNSYIISVGFAMGQVSVSVGKMVEGLGASGRIFYLLDRVPNIPKPHEQQERKNIKNGKKKQQQYRDGVNVSIPESNNDDMGKIYGDLEFKNVTFVYPSRPESIVLDNLSLKIPANSTTALVGSSGAGKSTIVSLLQRFYDINDDGVGSITIDGRNIASLDLQWLRKQIGYVQQEPQLFGMTIRENLLYGVENESTISQDEIEDRCRDAHAHDFITACPDGYETLVGERGVKLSGGQKQRVAIARALLTNCRILLLDEATSALDAESEHLVQQAIDKAVIGRTVVVVAHRLSTIRKANQIVVMDDHKIVDVGTHDDLLLRCTKYQDLIKRQQHDQQQYSGSDGVDTRNIAAWEEPEFYV